MCQAPVRLQHTDSCPRRTVLHREEHGLESHQLASLPQAPHELRSSCDPSLMAASTPNKGLQYTHGTPPMALVSHLCVWLNGVFFNNYI